MFFDCYLKKSLAGYKTKSGAKLRQISHTAKSYHPISLMKISIIPMGAK